MGSLLEGIETAPPKAKSAANARAQSERKLKLAFAAGGLLVGGALIAWNLGLFGAEKPGARQIDEKVPPEVANATGPQILKPSGPAASPQQNKPKSSINFH